MNSIRSIQIALCLGGAAAVFIICSLVQAAGGSSMFSSEYYPPDSALLDLAMNLTFWPGWLISLALVASAVRIFLEGAPAEDDAAEGVPGATEVPPATETSATKAADPNSCAGCGTPVTGAFCAWCGQRHATAPVSPLPVATTPDPLRGYTIPIAVCAIVTVVLTVGVGIALTSEEDPWDAIPDAQETGDWSFAAEGEDPESQPDSEVTETVTATESGDASAEETASSDEVESVHGCTTEDALHELEARREESLDYLTLDGRWVLQIDSKYAGVVDQFETASDGSHIFSLYDICVAQGEKAETWKYAAGFYHLRATDFGDSSKARQPEETWVLLMDPGADSLAPHGEGVVTDEDIQGACASFFPDLSGEELANACVPRKLTEPAQ